jgi:hypothetical protein
MRLIPSWRLRLNNSLRIKRAADDRNQGRASQTGRINGAIGVMKWAERIGVTSRNRKNLIAGWNFRDGQASASNNNSWKEKQARLTC